MKTRSACILGYAAIHKGGIHSSSRGYQPWILNTEPGAMLREQVYDLPLTSFGKLQVPDMLAFGAAALALAGNTDSIPAEETGISIGGVWGSLSTDIRYMESVVSGFPRPAYFSATLPSSPIAEIAIVFGLKGPNRAHVGGFASAFAALDSGLRALETGKAATMLIIAVQGLDKKDDSSPLVSGRDARWASALLLANATSEARRVSLSGRFSSTTMVYEPEESYFVELIKALHDKRTYSVDVDLPAFCGTLAVTKDS